MINIVKIAVIPYRANQYELTILDGDGESTG